MLDACVVVANPVAKQQIVEAGSTELDFLERCCRSTGRDS